MIVMTERQRADQLVDDAALVCVQHLLDAAARRDLDGVLAAMHPAARVRVGGSVAAEGLDAVAALVSGEWYTRPHATVTVLDTHVTGGSAYVRSHVRAERGYLAYSIIDVRDGRIHEISNFVSPLPHHEADPVADVAGAAVLDLRDGTEVVDLRDDIEVVDLRDDTEVAPEGAAPARRRRFLLPLAAVGSWLVQDLLLAAPVVATAASVGSWRAFVIFAPAYTVLSLVLSLVTVRLLRSPRPSAEGRFARWLARWLARSSESPRVHRWLRASRVLGFVTSAYLFSGPPTVWALHRLGIRRALARYAVLASVIWGVGFVVWYVAIAEVASLLL